MLLRIVLTAASVVALTAAANAADLGSYKGAPAYAGVNWSGLYGGVSGGYGSGNEADVTVTNTTTTAGNMGKARVPPKRVGLPADKSATTCKVYWLRIWFLA